jgi:hypothetical protein
MSMLPLGQSASQRAIMAPSHRCSWIRVGVARDPLKQQPYESGHALRRWPIRHTVCCEQSADDVCQQGTGEEPGGGLKIDGRDDALPQRARERADHGATLPGDRIDVQRAQSGKPRDLGDEYAQGIRMMSMRVASLRV